VPALFPPSPSLVWGTAVDMMRSGACLRVFGGFLAATLVSIPLGMLMGNFRVTADRTHISKGAYRLKSHACRRQ
jgi:ABC-type nitrate/sulfonate/bicarbonate transport system permease component